MGSSSKHSEYPLSTSEIVILMVLVCVVFPLCWIGENIPIKTKLTELENFFLGLGVIVGSAAVIGLCLLLVLFL